MAVGRLVGRLLGGIGQSTPQEQSHQPGIGQGLMQVPVGQVTQAKVSIGGMVVAIQPLAL